MTVMFVIASLILMPTLVGGRCSVCLLAGERSTVTGGMCSSTLLAVIGHYDEDGRYHSTDPNVTTCSHTCSRGHQLTTRPAAQRSQ
jgi:hypothetical protein